MGDNGQPMTEAELSEFVADLNTVCYGYSRPFYWIEMPDGECNHCITYGKFMASLAVLRMNYPYLKLEQKGELPKRKEKRK